MGSLATQFMDYCRISAIALTSPKTLVVETIEPSPPSASTTPDDWSMVSTEGLVEPRGLFASFFSRPPVKKTLWCADCNSQQPVEAFTPQHREKTNSRERYCYRHH